MLAASAMVIEERTIEGSGVTWVVRCPEETDAGALASLRIMIDGETENLDRERGEDVLTPDDFKMMIREDRADAASLFLVAVADGKIVGFARCAGNKLVRYRHKAAFGICLLRSFWGCGIGTSLVETALEWADRVGVGKLSLAVVETNTVAIQLYKRHGFVTEGVLANDRIHRDGRYYNTLMMGRLRPA